ncbi:MAG: hypothetical protein LBC40_01035 [Dysgonamonadaceae bacterium]|jgi:hypothetical protein|nr:hypothetical protein [Dysgonamonadaceae bacterium]
MKWGRILAFGFLFFTLGSSLSVFHSFSQTVVRGGERYLLTHRRAEKSKFNIGPFSSFLGRNNIEGFRLGIGGETTPCFNKHFYIKGLASYGFKDEQYKYSGTLSWSFNGKDPGYEYGIRGLSFQYQYDIQSLNEHFFPVVQRNIFLSFKRQQEDMMLYQRKGLLKYKQELPTGFAAETWMFLQNDTPAGALQFAVDDGAGNIKNVDSYNVAGVGLKVSYAKSDEPLRYGYTPNISLTFHRGIKDLLNGDYNYRYAELATHKTILLRFGQVSLNAKTGKIWGNVPFPLLIIPNYNLSYGMLQGGYSLMNQLEFINDKYVSFDMEMYFDGLLFGTIPGISEFKIREILTFSGLYGDLSFDKLPENKRELFIFPQTSRLMGKDPYLEAGIGLSILDLFRIDYVRRLTYLDKPGISESGFRFSLKLALK